MWQMRATFPSAVVYILVEVPQLTCAVFVPATAKDAPSPSRDNDENNDKKITANLPNANNPEARVALNLFGQSERINIDCKANTNLNISSSIRAIEETGKEGDRLPIEIAIALDVSGSMRGEKLQLCQDTLELISKYLLKKDKISVTTFDTNVKQVFKLSAMTAQNKQNLESVIKKVKAGSSTNLSGGLLDAISVLKKSGAKGGSKAVLTEAMSKCFAEDLDLFCGLPPKV